MVGIGEGGHRQSSRFVQTISHLTPYLSPDLGSDGQYFRKSARSSAANGGRHAWLDLAETTSCWSTTTHTFYDGDGDVALNDCAPALFICALSMRGMDGLNVIRRTSAQPPERGRPILVIAITKDSAACPRNPPRRPQ